MPRFSTKSAGDFLNSFMQANAGQDIVRGLLTQRQIESSQLEDELARQKANTPPPTPRPAFDWSHGQMYDFDKGSAFPIPGYQPPQPKPTEKKPPKFAQDGRLQWDDATGSWKETPGWKEPPARPGRGGAGAKGSLAGMTLKQKVDLWNGVQRYPVYDEEAWKAAVKQSPTLKYDDWVSTQTPVRVEFDNPADEALYNSLTAELTQAGVFGASGPYGDVFGSMSGPSTPAWMAPQGGDADFDYIPGRGLVPRGANAPR